MVKYPSVKHIATTVLLLIAFVPAFAARVDVPSLPPAPYADTEAATNVAFGAGVAGDNVFALSLALDASPSNNVEVAFGCDADGNGILDCHKDKVTT